MRKLKCEFDTLKSTSDKDSCTKEKAENDYKVIFKS